MTPYYPVPFRPGNKVIKQYEESFVDPVGNHSIVVYVDFKDKDGKMHERHILRVKRYRN
jgi:hypothetical protein